MKTPRPDVTVGQRIKLLLMPEDPCPIEPGSLGTIDGEPVELQGRWNVPVKWDSGRTLSMVYPVDRFERVD